MRESRSEISGRVRERKKTGRSFGALTGLLVGFICGFAAAVLVLTAGGRLGKENPGNTNTIQSDENGLMQDGDWNLVLVNRWNPLQGDNGIQLTTLSNRSREHGFGMRGDNGIQLTTLSNGEKVDERIYPHLQSMFDDMRSEGVYPVVASGYRTGAKQQEIYDEKIAYYQEQGYSYDDAKKETEKWVAIPGTSEHQLGLAVDINADGVNSAGQEVYDWLDRNAYRYGFIKRYPSDKTEITGIGNEPWHYRYVGKTAAKEIYEQGICLEEYLGKTNG